MWLEPSSLRLSQYDLPGNTEPAKGLRIAVISDLHAGSTFIDTAKMDRIVTLTNQARPDLILLTGDYVVSIHRKFGGNPVAIETIVAHLKSLRARLGVYAVIGNHDRWEDAGRIAAAFRHGGIPVLENSHVLVATEKGPLYLVGIGDYFTHAAQPLAALPGIPSGANILCFTHSPDIFPSIPSSCSLTIAGHTHGGQVRLPLLGRLIVPSRYGQRYAAGYIRENGKSMFVSTGIGTSILPIRLGVPPEISLLTLHYRI